VSAAALIDEQVLADRVLAMCQPARELCAPAVAA